MKFELSKYNKTYSSKEREINTVRIHMEINTMCNNKCAYCYARANKQTWGTMMSRDYINETLISNMNNLITTLRDEGKYLDVVLLGGEPTLHPMFPDVVKFLCDNEVRISITTNGTYPYKKVMPSKNVRWAYTFHPSQVTNVISWFQNIVSGKDDWWEVAISPLIDCWGSDDEIVDKSSKIKYIIELCHEHDIKVQPTFQFNPYESGHSHIEMSKVIKYYDFLEHEYPIYEYNDTPVNDYTILKNKWNHLQGCTCVNNNFQLDVRGRLTRCCSDEEISWNELSKLSKLMTCPLPECTCYGFLSLYKEL